MLTVSLIRSLSALALRAMAWQRPDVIFICPSSKQFSAFARAPRRDRLRGLMTVLRHALAGAFLIAAASSPVSAQQTVSNEFFEAKIRPVLAAKCYACHNSKMKEPKGYLTLDSREGVMKGGTLGPAIVP